MKKPFVETNPLWSYQPVSQDNIDHSLMSFYVFQFGYITLSRQQISDLIIFLLMYKDTVNIIHKTWSVYLK